jgi:phosphorylase/glycogen(starch) synthase
MTKRYQEMVADNYALATQLTDWKNKVTREWNGIELLNLDLPNRSKQIITLGKSYYGEIKLEIGELNIQDVGVELVAAEQKSGELIIREKHDFIPVSQEGSVALYRLEVTPDAPGLLMLAIRIYPKHKWLPHRQDFALVKWL